MALLRFYLDYSRVSGNQTPADLDMEDGDELDAEIMSISDIVTDLKTLEAGKASSTETTVALWSLVGLVFHDAANRAPIIDAGVLPPLVVLVTSGSAEMEDLFADSDEDEPTGPSSKHRMEDLFGDGGYNKATSLGGQYMAAWLLGILACDDAKCAAIVDAGGIPPLVALARSGTAGGQRAAQALSNLAVIDLDYAE